MSANNMFKMVFASAAVRFPKFLLRESRGFERKCCPLYGNVAPGGILNMVEQNAFICQRRRIKHANRKLLFYKPSIDIYPLNDFIAYRFTDLMKIHKV
jgi:hypothetical protein